MRKHHQSLVIACIMLPLVAGGCQSLPSEKPASITAESSPRFFDGLGSHTRPVATSSADAQRYFNQGLVLAYAFNHDEAIRSFQAAAKADPACAMAWWGIALCNGPHINNAAMDEAHSKAAWDALQQALSFKATAHEADRDLIDALATRYAWPAPQDRKPLDEAYAEAMRSVWHAHRNDADIGSLFAESMMDLRPWDLWQQGGSPQPGTEEIVATIEEALRLDANHPLANHLYIHAVEASPNPARAIAAADRLRTLVPGSGHLTHMPSHIDVRVGRWQEAAACNERAIKIDADYRKISPNQGFYHVYMAHNYQFLAFTGMMEGRRDVALKASRDMVKAVPPAFIDVAAPLIDPILSMPLDVMKRFGMWDEILHEPMPDARLPITTAIWRLNRATALAVKGDIAGAEREQAVFRECVQKLPKDAMMTINPAAKVMELADHVLAGELAYRRGQTAAAVSELAKAVEIEDTLTYMEPPDWLIPARHTLGAVLTAAGRHDEAQRVYRDDLVKWPENGWSLMGLAECLKATQHTSDAAQVQARFKKAWARSQVKTGPTCLCVDAKDNDGR
ncbi:MAG: hypothetical protein H7210_05245 [Pyrinomonadaceae bacterium]|nr:hypothetical protein [Phycisphaerales bacterium]